MPLPANYFYKDGAYWKTDSSGPYSFDGLSTMALINSGTNLRSAAPTTLGVILARTMAGVSDTKILFVGDSTTRGRGAVPGTTDLVALVAKRMVARLPVPVIDNFITPLDNGSSTVDARITMGAGWIGATGYGWGDRSVWFNQSGVVTTLTVVYSGGFSDKIRIYYTPYPGAPGVFTPTINGVAKTGQSMAGVAAIAVYEATYTRSATATVVITPTVPLILITGMEFIDTTQKCVYLANAGATGTQVSDWNTAGVYSTSAMMTSYDPDHTILSLGINESVLNVPTATWKANITTLINTFKTSGSVDLWRFFQTDPAQPFVATLQPQYYAEFSNLANTLDCGVIDVYGATGGYTYMNSLGLMTDAAHPNAGGYALATPSISDRLLAFA